MTSEEAVETILKGEAWAKCRSCDGRGYFDGVPAAHEVPQPYDCVACNGSRHERVYEFVVACEVLGREYPSPPKNLRKALAESAGQHLREMLRRPSQMRMLFPPQMITKVDDEES